MKITSEKVTAFMALMAVAWGGFIYLNDIRALSRDMAVRNVGWASKELCDDPSNEQMWDYLNSEIARYNRYADADHRFTGAKNHEDLGCERKTLSMEPDT